MSESYPICANPLTGGTRKHAAGSVGPSAGPDVRLYDGTALLPAGKADVEGEVVVKGGMVIAGYEHATAEQAASSHTSDGYLRTGDMGRLDADGHLYLVGRSKELINRAGEKISPFEVEAAASAHPSIKECMAFAMVHPTLGEAVGLSIVPADGKAGSAPTLEKLLAECFEGKLAPAKWPAWLEVVTAIEKSATKKPKRLEKTKATEHVFAVSASTTEPPVMITDLKVPPKIEALGFPPKALNAIASLLRGTLPEDPDEPLFLYGLSSMSILPLLPVLREAYPSAAAKITGGALVANPTLTAWSKLVGGGPPPGPVKGVLLQLARGPADKAALVFIHPATGLLGLYQGLVNANRFPDRAVYGLQHPYYTDSLPLHSSLGDVCGLYREALLEGLPKEQPIVLAVYSSGGIFCLELAHQLQHVGRPVAGFVLIDSCIGNTGPSDVFKQCSAMCCACGDTKGVGICAPCVYGCLPVQKYCCAGLCCGMFKRTGPTKLTYNEKAPPDPKEGGMMQKMFLPVAYDFYREGIDGPWKRSPNPCKELSKTHKSYPELRKALVAHAHANFPNEVDPERLERMMRVHIEVAAPSIMGFTMVGLLTDAPVLALYAPTDPMNSLLPLWTLSANYKSVYVPFDLKRSDREGGTAELFKGAPTAMRNHMLCMLQPSFVDGVVAEMKPFLEKVDKGPAAPGSQAMAR